jgi:hypothetical protein
MCKRLNPLKRGLIEPICILLGGARAKALYRQPAGHSLGEDAPRWEVCLLPAKRTELLRFILNGCLHVHDYMCTFVHNLLPMVSGELFVIDFLWNVLRDGWRIGSPWAKYCENILVYLSGVITGGAINGLVGTNAIVFVVFPFVISRSTNKVCLIAYETKFRLRLHFLYYPLF